MGQSLRPASTLLHARKQTNRQSLGVFHGCSLSTNCPLYPLILQNDGLGPIEEDVLNQNHESIENSSNDIDVIHDPFAGCEGQEWSTSSLSRQEKPRYVSWRHWDCFLEQIVQGFRDRILHAGVYHPFSPFSRSGSRKVIKPIVTLNIECRKDTQLPSNLGILLRVPKQCLEEMD